MQEPHFVARFSTPSGEYPGAYFQDYFRDDGWRRAREAPTSAQALLILADTYLGPDVDGVGVSWWACAPKQNASFMDFPEDSDHGRD